MQSRLIINIVLFILVCVLGVFLFVTETGNNHTEEILLTSMNPENIHTIVVTRKQTDEIVFKKENKTWQMQSPYALPANPVRINTMLGLLKAHSYTQLNKKELQLDRFHLQDPEVSIRFNQLQIDFGDVSPLGDQRYVMVGDSVHLINDSLFQQLQTNATFFLDNRLLPAGSEITAIHLPDHELQLQDGLWKISPDTSISADTIIQLINAWQNLEAISIRPYEDTAVTGMVNIEFKDMPGLEFPIVSMPPQLILARPELGIQYHISSYDAGRLFLMPANEQAPPVTN